MRFVIALLAVLGVVLIGSAAVPAVAMADSAYALAADAPTGQLDVNVDVDEGGGAWWADPIWIAVGVIGLVLLIVIIAMATRGGGTTVIKD